jgi:hypothetical protein
LAFPTIWKAAIDGPIWATSPAFRRGFENASAGRASATDPMAKIITSIIAFNQADKIEDAINSVLWTNEIVLADALHANYSRGGRDTKRPAHWKA